MTAVDSGWVLLAVRVLVVATVAVAGVAASASAAGSVSPQSVGGPSGSAVGQPNDATCPHSDELHFARLGYVEQRGDVARVTLLFDDGFSDDSLDLYVRGDDNEYDSQVEVRDGNDDGRVTVLFDTGAAGGPRPTETFRVAGPDEVLGRETTPLDGPLETGTYDLAAWGPNCARGDARLVVEQPTPVALSAYRGNRSLLDDLSSAADVRNALVVGDLDKTYAREHLAESAGLTPTGDQPSREGTPVLRGATLALALEAPGLADRLGDAEDSTGRFRALLGRTVTVEAAETDPSLDGGESLPERYDPSAFGDWQVHPDPANGTVYLLLDTRGPYAPDSDGTDYGAVGERYVVTAAGDDGGTGTTAFEFAEPTADLDLSGILEEVLVTATTDATVTGTTTLPNGTTLTVTLRSDGASLSTTREVTAEDGRFEVTFDLAGVESGTWFEAFVTHGGAELDRDDGRVRPSATVRVSAVDDGGGDRVRVDTAALSDGGFVVVHSRSDDGPVVRTSAYLPPGSHTNLTVSLDDAVGGTPSSDGTTLVAVAHHDSDGDRQFDPEDDEAYRWGSPEDGVRLLVATPTPTTTDATPTTAPAPTTPVPSTDARTPPASSATPDAGPIPAPGPLPALVALVVAALLAAAAASRNGTVDR